jgi:gliding motility-associated-like protein
MKNIFAFGLMVFCFPLAFVAQNLVPNPSFEEYSDIPGYWDQLYKATPWRNPTSATPDFMHVDCMTTGQFRATIPENYWGWQFPRTGKGYLVLHMWTSEYQEIEYAQVDLLEPLVPNREYGVSVWVSRADYITRSSNCQGFLFTETAFTDYGFIEGLPPQVNNLEIIRDTGGWVQIGGVFVPDKPYKVMTVGNFYGESPPFDTIYESDFGWPNATYYWDDFSVTLINREPDFDFSIKGTCLPATLNLSTQPFFPGDDITWDWNDGTVQHGGDIERVFENNGIYLVELTITHNTVNYSVEKEVVVDIPLAPIADFEIMEKKLGMKKEIHFENLSQHASQWLWDFGDGNQSDEEIPVHIFDTLGNYRIILVASNELGCADTAVLDVYVPCANRMFFNAITPNGDGQNEVLPFDRIAVCDGPFNIKIFSRWGNLVYESDDPAEPWRAENVPSGTYYFVVSYKGGREEGYIDVIK